MTGKWGESVFGGRYSEMVNSYSQEIRMGFIHIRIIIQDYYYIRIIYILEWD